MDLPGTRDAPAALPIVGAPLAGGPSTPALAAAVSDAGGLGFLAGGYRSARELRDEIAALRGLTDRPFGLWEEKLELALAERPDVVSFTFGPPPADVVTALHEREIRAWGTVTSAEEARVAAAAGVDTLVTQRAFTGRSARGIVNRFLTEHAAAAPAA